MPKPEYDKTKTVALICERMNNGKSLRAVLRQDGMPDKTTFLRWLDEDEGGALRTQYARAREGLGDEYADELREVAFNDQDDANSRRVKLDALKWMASKLHPRRYGDKVDLGRGQSENLAPTKTEVTYRWES